MILALKLTLVPALIALVTVAGRRWGPRVGGLLASLPLVAGPVLLFLAIEQGTAFAAEAARGTLVALVAVAGSAVAYAWAAQRTPWWFSLPASWTSFLLMTLSIQPLRLRLVPALVAAVASFVAGRAMLPSARPACRVPAPAAWDLPLRMVAAMSLILLVTGLAESLGPSLTGALTPFPIALTILLAFTHAQQGTAPMVRFLHGFMPGMWSFAVFCFVASAALVALGPAAGFTLALAAQIVVQSALLWRIRRWPSRRSGSISAGAREGP